jgi:branched-chain amino acid transport system ATP-binding protein
MTLLVTTGMSVTYGGVRAVNEVNITVHPNSLVGLIGPNGAGKTSFIDGITGFTPTSGRIEFDGSDVSTAPAHRRARLGLGRTWQSLELFDDLSVRENLMVAAERQSVGGFFADVLHPSRNRRLAPVDAAFDVLGISALADTMPTELSQGQRKLIGVARALAAQPKLVCLDEPAAGLDSAESQQLGAQLRRMVDTGVTIFLVDHDMGLVLSVCDYIYVIEFGQLIAQGTPTEIRNDDRVIAAYLGESARKDKTSAQSEVHDLDR